MKIEKSFEHYHDDKHKYYRKLRRRFSFILDNVIGQSVIDIGCGTGLTPFLLSQRNDIEHVVGIDIQQEALDEAIENNKENNTLFYLCTAENLPFEDNSFDTSIITETLEHVYDVDKTLKEAYRVTRDKIIITVPNNGKVKKREGPWSHVRSFNKDTLLAATFKYFICEDIGIIDNYLYYIGGLNDNPKKS